MAMRMKLEDIVLSDESEQKDGTCVRPLYGGFSSCCLCWSCMGLWKTVLAWFTPHWHAEEILA